MVPSKAPFIFASKSVCSKRVKSKTDFFDLSAVLKACGPIVHCYVTELLRMALTFTNLTCVPPFFASSNIDNLEKIGDSYVIKSADPKDSGLYELQIRGGQNGASFLSIIIRGKLILIYLHNTGCTEITCPWFFRFNPTVRSRNRRNFTETAPQAIHRYRLVM